MAPAEDDISIDEKRVYAGSAGRTDAYVATGSGVIRVAISADKVGAFEMVTPEPARDVAVLPRPDAPDLLGVATDDGLLVAIVDEDPAFDLAVHADENDDADDTPVIAVSPHDDAFGGHDDSFLVARADGRIDRVRIGRAGTTDGTTPEATANRIGNIEAPRAIDGGLIAAADGVHRVVARDGVGTDLDLVAVGLDDAVDVAGVGTPLAATSTGLHWLGNGWMTARNGAAEAVAADGDGHAMAVLDGALFVRGDDETGWEPASWSKTTLPVEERVVALGYGPGTAVVVTDAGTLCVDAGDGWRHQVIGVREVAGVALTVVA